MAYRARILMALVRVSTSMLKPGRRLSRLRLLQAEGDGHRMFVLLLPLVENCKDGGWAVKQQ